MCGICGFFVERGAIPDGDVVLSRMAKAIKHRGPDDGGTWVDAEAGIGLGHRRLSIVDLSVAGRQPMASHSGRYVVAYNGEIYNHVELRQELDAATGGQIIWRGHSDTEVMLAAIDRWGMDGALSRLNGMFALALWDRRDRNLILARDRLGEKPLYYGNAGGRFVFGSELKALKASGVFDQDLDRAALSQFLRFNYVPGTQSIWAGISKLAPAHYVVIRENGRRVERPVCYWNFKEVAEAGANAPLADGPTLIDEMESLLRDAVGRRMEADVPLGAFLSGGIDSSLIVALMQAQSARPVRTFSIGFNEAGYDEAVHAKAVAKHLGTDHTELYVTSDEALAVIPKLATMWDEPFSDSSQIPTYLVSKMARDHVTVALSGDGGDELFGGYNRYFLAPRLRRATSFLPGPLLGGAASLLRSRRTAQGLAALSKFLPRRFRFDGLEDRLPKVADVIDSGSVDEIYRKLISHWYEPDLVVIGGAASTMTFDHSPPDFGDFRQMMMYMDTLEYLPGDILTKVDRASMAVSLEARVPFLDHRVVEMAWRLPMSAKFHGGKGKAILRNILYRHVPQSLVERPKMGFGVPIGDWLRGPLRDWAEAMLDTTRLKNQGIFAPEPISVLWNEHKSGARNWHFKLWDILMFQQWWDEQRS